MDEYIDRESIYKTLSMEKPLGWNNDDLAELFRGAKPADVAPVRHGRWERGAIISGYQGIGKSTLSSGCSGYVDLESGNFFVGGKRSEDWYIPYCQIAVHLAEQGYRVFISSHAVVRAHLASMPKTVDLFVCFPSYALQGAWTKKLENRYKSTQKDKDYRAWKNAEERYAENIRELHETKGFVPIVIHDMNYSLSKLLDNYCPDCGAKMDGGTDIKASFGDAPEDVGYQMIKE